MKSFLFITTLLITSITTNAQDTTYRKILADFIRSGDNTTPTYYTDTSLLFYHKFSDLVKHGSIKGRAADGQAASISFSRAELNEIDARFKNQQPIPWPGQLLENAVRLSRDSLNAYIAARRSVENYKERFYYHFSQPVYLRNNSIVLFRVAQMIDISAGYDFIIIYTRESAGWKQKLVYIAGAW